MIFDLHVFIKYCTIIIILLVIFLKVNLHEWNWFPNLHKNVKGELTSPFQPPILPPRISDSSTFQLYQPKPTRE